MPPHRLIVPLLLWLTAHLGGVELRLASLNVLDGVGAPGSPEFAAALEQLARVAPDVVVFQEVAAQVTAPGDARHFGDVRALLERLGFPGGRSHLATAGDAFSGQTYLAGDFGNSTQSLVVASRHPITQVVQIGRGVAGRKEMTRFPLLVRLDLPEPAPDVWVVNVHLKQGSTQADQFRRALEGWRIVQFLRDAGLGGAAVPLFVAGDFNEDPGNRQSTSFSTAGVGGGHAFSDGSRLPTTFQLGSDVPGVLGYAPFPQAVFAAAGVSPLSVLQADGESARTYNAAGNSRLDYLLTGTASLQQGAARLEVYNSALEPVFDGLPKAGSLPLSDLSWRASDHFLLYGDFQLCPAEAVGLVLERLTLAVGDTLPEVVRGTVSLPQASERERSVRVGVFRPGVVEAPAEMIIPAGSRSAEFQIQPEAVGAGPDRQITLVAEAEGHRRGLARLRLQRSAARGDVIFSQYHEPASGSAGRAVEIMNVSRRDIDLRMEPLRILRYTNGATTAQLEAELWMGLLPRGTVVVVGDDATGEHLVREGLLAPPAGGFGAFPNGWTFNGEGGRTIFVKDPFTFNGNDALELRLNHTRCEVFGMIGEDPGVAWESEGVSTADQNLERRPEAIAPSAGFRAPHAFFLRGSGTLDGFGRAPALHDPYALWALERSGAGGAADPLADDDGDGRANLLEFLWGDGEDAEREADGIRLRLPARGNVRVVLESSADLRRFIPRREMPPQILGQWLLPPGEQGSLYWRLRVVKP